MNDDLHGLIVLGSTRVFSSGCAFTYTGLSEKACLSFLRQTFLVISTVVFEALIFSSVFRIKF